MAFHHSELWTLLALLTIVFGVVSIFAACVGFYGFAGLLVVVVFASARDVVRARAAAKAASSESRNESDDS